MYIEDMGMECKVYTYISDQGYKAMCYATMCADDTPVEVILRLLKEKMHLLYKGHLIYSVGSTISVDKVEHIREYQGELVGVKYKGQVTSVDDLLRLVNKG